MKLDRSLKHLRKQAESLMSTTVSVRRYTGETTMDELGV